jgi:opacity protein-like surface antigen
MILDSFLMVTSSRPFGALSSFTTVCSSFFLLTPQAFGNQLSWNETPVQPSPLQWLQRSPSDAQVRPLSWQTVTRLDIVAGNGSTQQSLSSTTGVDPALPLNPETPLDPSTPKAASPELAKSVQQNPWIIGFGGGARIGIGEPTYPEVYGRLSRIIDQNIAISVRPRYIFGNVDRQGRSNSDGAFQLPLTLDLKPLSWFSPYLGGGIATNTDTSGKTDGMLSLGADISISRKLSLDIGINYIFQSNTFDNNNRDIEFSTVLYYRF